MKELAASLKDDDAESAKAVAFALTQIGPTATQTWPAVVEMLQHEKTQARRLAADALGEWARRQRRRRSYLRYPALKDPDAQVRVPSRSPEAT